MRILMCALGALVSVGFVVPAGAVQVREDPACSGYRSDRSRLLSQLESANRDLRSVQSNVTYHEMRFRDAQERYSRARTDSDRQRAESDMRSENGWIQHYSSSLRDAQRRVEGIERELKDVQERMVRAKCL